MTTPRPHNDSLRLDLIRVTAELLAHSGPGAVSLREIAHKCNTSTTAIYSLFGGKAQIIKAVAAEGFADLAISLTAADKADSPHAALLSLASAYRAWGLANPALFSAMYSQPQPNFSPGAPARTDTSGTMEGLLRSSIDTALQPLHEASRQAAHSSKRSAEDIARAVWAASHGWVMLELRGVMNSGDFESYASGTIRGILE